MQEHEPIQVRITPQDPVVLGFPGLDRSTRMEDLGADKGRQVLEALEETK